MNTQKFKLNSKVERIHAITLSLDDLNKIFELIREWNQKAIEIHTHSEKDSPWNIFNQGTDEEFEQYKSKLIERYCVGIEVVTYKGEFIRVFKPEEILDKKIFPDNIISIKITNTILFDSYANLAQPFRIIVNFDFRRPTVFDLTSNINETSNSSLIEITGTESGWTEGVFAAIIEFVKQRQNNRQLVHGKNIFILFSWLFFIPIILWNFYKIEKFVFNRIPEMSDVLLIICYLYLFFIAMIILTLIFRFIRNLYPPIVILENEKNKRKFLRTTVSSVLSIIILEQFAEVIISLVRLLM